MTDAAVIESSAMRFQAAVWRQTEAGRKLRLPQAVNVKLLPVPHSTSFSGISFSAR